MISACRLRSASAARFRATNSSSRMRPTGCPPSTFEHAFFDVRQGMDCQHGDAVPPATGGRQFNWSGVQAAGGGDQPLDHATDHAIGGGYFGIGYRWFVHRSFVAIPAACPGRRF